MSILKALLRLFPGGSAATREVFDSGDVLIDVDTRMLQGRYSEAVDMIRGAIKLSPSDVFLQEKLLEVLFVAANSEGFLEAAKKYQSGLRRLERWDAIKTLGKQMWPDERMFH